MGDFLVNFGRGCPEPSQVLFALVDVWGGYNLPHDAEVTNLSR